MKTQSNPLIPIYVLCIMLGFLIASCKPYGSTTKPKNGHPHLYQSKPKSQ